LLSLASARAALFLCLAAGLSVAGCASRDASTATTSGADAAGAAHSPARGSWLFRAELESADGGGSVRLTLRRFDDSSFDLAAADVLGQARWRLLAAGGEAIWIDRARERFCRLPTSRGLPAGEFRTVLRIADLPGLLLRELPLATATTPATGHAELEDAAGRRFAGERAGGLWRSWMLRVGGRPVLWFRVDEEGGARAAGATLSGREPAFVLRWRETARGELGMSENLDLAPPSGFAEETCPDAAPA
jgi:hypothetical protein